MVRWEPVIMGVRLARLAAITIVMAVALAAATREPSDSVSVTSNYISRVHKVGGDVPGLEASSSAELMLHGELIRKAAACANIYIEKAIDSGGADLANLGMDEFRSNVERQDVYISSPPGEPPTANVDVALGPLSKGARKLARLKGHLQLMILSDESRSLTIPHLKSCLDKTMPIPQLAHEHIQLSVSQTPDRVMVIFEGNTPIIEKIEIDDADGKSISKELFMDFTFVQTLRRDFALPRAADDRMSIKIQYAASYRIVSVPFDLKEFPDPQG